MHGSTISDWRNAADRLNGSWVSSSDNPFHSDPRFPAVDLTASIWRTMIRIVEEFWPASV
jgi:hypothetical protein